MTYGCGKSDSAILAGKPTNKAEQSAAESVERRVEAKGEYGSAKHVPGTGPGKRVTGAGPHTASGKAQEEGEVHRALPPYHRPAAPGGVLRTQGECRSRSGRAEMGRIRGGICMQKTSIRRFHSKSGKRTKGQSDRRSEGMLIDSSAATGSFGYSQLGTMAFQQF
jgi:hypothetical protein